MLTLSIILFVLGILILLFVNTLQKPIWDLIGFVLIIVGYIMIMGLYLKWF